MQSHKDRREKNLRLVFSFDTLQRFIAFSSAINVPYLY